MVRLVPTISFLKAVWLSPLQPSKILSRDDEFSVVLPCRVNPSLENFKDEEVLLNHHLAINDLAFKISITLIDKRRPDE